MADNYNSWQSQNGFGNGFNQPVSNIILVTSIEEALFKSNTRNSDMVYFDQNRDVFYRVKVDLEGRKLWKEIPYGTSSTANSAVSANFNIDSFETRLTNIEKKLGINSSEVTDNVKSNG